MHAVMHTVKNRTVYLVALALMLILVGPAAASNQTCPDGQSEWFFYWTWATGWSSTDMQEACDEAWNSYSSVSITSGPHVDVRYVNISTDPCVPILGTRLHCSVCIDGFPPAWAHEVHELAPVDAGGAGDVVVGHYPGKVVSVELNLGGGSGSTGPYYDVKVVTFRENEMKHVKVDAKSGQIIKDPEPGVCENRR